MYFSPGQINGPSCCDQFHSLGLKLGDWVWYPGKAELGEKNKKEYIHHSLCSRDFLSHSSDQKERVFHGYTLYAVANSSRLWVQETW